MAKADQAKKRHRVTQMIIFNAFSMILAEN